MFGVRSGYEQPRYDVVARPTETLEVRRYAPRVAAEARVDASDGDEGRSAAFRLLFDYVSGANRENARIDMTSPVETAQASRKIAMTVPVETGGPSKGPVTMRFFLPIAQGVDSAPEPLDPHVRIVEVPEQTLAVLRFSGFRDQESVSVKKRELLSVLASTPWQAASEPVAYFYDPPWTLPFFRRNEVVVAVTRQDS